MTYNFDIDAWYERERGALEARRARGELDGESLAAQLAELDRRYEELLHRLDGSFQLPPARRRE